MVAPALKKGRGRPNVASKSIEAARKAGDYMVFAYVSQLKAAAETLAEDRVQKLKANMQREVTATTKRQPLALVEAGLGLSGVVGSQQSNRRLPGARAARQEEGATTKLTTCKLVHELKKKMH